jgi:hypothetical protein
MYGLALRKYHRLMEHITETQCGEEILKESEVRSYIIVRERSHAISMAYSCSLSGGGRRIVVNIHRSQLSLDGRNDLRVEMVTLFGFSNTVTC